jgi:hypothetical protein
MALFDCFTFNDELDLLEVRLRLGVPHVTRFVLVEATTTYSGKSKPLHFDLNRDRFAAWDEQIHHIVVDDMPDPSQGRWAAEVHQRNALLRGIEDAEPTDVVIVADVDEIVHPEVLATLQGPLRGLTALEMRKTFHYANWELPLHRFARLTRASIVGDLDDPHQQRNHVEPQVVIADAGRHLSGLGGRAERLAKYESYAHAELDNPKDKSPDYLGHAFRFGVDPYIKELVEVVPPSQLCSIQREFSRLRPDLFSFESLPPIGSRLLFRWYALWRARQQDHVDLIATLDDRYDDRRLSVAGIALTEAIRQALFVRPRRGLGAVKRKLKRIVSSR